MKVIEVKHLSKKYLINSFSSLAHSSLKENLSNKVKQGFCSLLGIKKKESLESVVFEQEFWALKDLSFSLEAGDRLAILGRNGAGKSTLLKLLTRVTEPTLGSIKIKGRIVSLLEVGTGFHPDLTGRENIFLNGAIMGMSYREMKKKFDEIVAFADIEKFLDIPIKRYSSGMYMRLGFAVAAHLNSDLLILDEILAVGDGQFQEKCLKKVNEMGTGGKTVIFVSHSIQAVMALCNKGILLEQGRMQGIEPLDKCISRYISSSPLSYFSWQGNLGDEHIRFREVSFKSFQVHSGFFKQSEQIALDIKVEMLVPHPDLILGFSVLNSSHQLIARSRLGDHPYYRSLKIEAGFTHLSFDLDLSLFHPGEYQIKLECALLNKKKILNDDILLKFTICLEDQPLKYEQGAEKEGISLGNRWHVLTS